MVYVCFLIVPRGKETVTLELPRLGHENSLAAAAEVIFFSLYQRLGPTDFYPLLRVIAAWRHYIGHIF